MKTEFEIENDTIISRIKGGPFQPEKRQTTYETSWSLPVDIGSGTFQKIELRPGLVLYLSDYQVKESFTTCIESHRSAFGFGFWLSGKAIASSSSFPSRFFDKHGGCSIFYYPDQSGSVEDLKNSYRRSVSLLVEPDLLHTFLRGTLDNMPMDFKILMDGPAKGYYKRDGRITPLISQTLEQLFHCPFGKATRLLFLESKALELIALRLNQLTVSGKACRQSGGLRASDIDKIHMAASRLCHDLENPPTLFELAAFAGVSHATLNRGFRQVFGTTVFGYLRQNRLRQAKKLLDEYQHNVTETAFAVGYNSLSSFARAFRDQYGCNPHACIGETRRPGN
jgi:AraC family transcriptional regulator, transcriptional activator of the genes for pyochelin and ferripyochelin receptors